MDSSVALQAEDYIVIAATLLVPLGIGVLFAIKDSNKATRDVYLLGERRMSLLPVTLSLFATYVSAISLMGSPTDIYTYGSMFIIIHLGFGLAFMIGAFTMVPLMHPLRVTSIYEYLQRRFDSTTVRVFSVTIGMLTNICYLSIALLTPALGLQVGTGIDLWVSLVAIGTIGTLYTTIGGMKSVVWTDAFQCLVIFVALLVIIIKGCLIVGGGSSAWSLAEEGGRTSFDEINPDPRTRHSWWGTLIGGTIYWFGNIYNQSTVQRVASLRTMKSAKLCLVLNSVLIIVYGVMVLWFGIVIYAYSHFTRCDPFTAGLISNRNQLPPYFVLSSMSVLPGVSGLYMAALFSSALSTISSGINSLAANTVEDIVKRLLRGQIERTITLITKIFVAFYGLLIIVLAFAASFLDGPVTQIVMAISGACGSPIVGIFFLGALVPSANKLGAITGGVVALAANVYIVLGNQFYGRKYKPLPLPPTDMCNINTTQSTILMNLTIPSTLSTPHVALTTSETSMDHKYGFGFFLYDISYVWYSCIGIVLSFLVGTCVSLCTKRFVAAPKKDPDLLFSCCCKTKRYQVKTEINGKINIAFVPTDVPGGIQSKENDNVNSQTTSHL